ncbi:MAG: hypothetical protein CVV64_10335 [Candidatus Wallbacteria bacterium HGW-Wallbacteria-1]|uniref:Uncharacterized protein n=1 Tax=Candidatus Wallbacteria bacterium HGW-Wallbacteria-1 TaxID=2013854 RepID=A0A2N1PPU8_9BACT|nr:MAG: hypothetical protein CVV64_10335 [Candidatus Wallbacteria bacterium HGW-Wallbacteria-1]
MNSNNEKHIDDELTPLDYLEIDRELRQKEIERSKTEEKLENLEYDDELQRLKSELEKKEQQ